MFSSSPSPGIIKLKTDAVYILVKLVSFNAKEAKQFLLDLSSEEKSGLDNFTAYGGVKNVWIVHDNPASQTYTLTHFKAFWVEAGPQPRGPEPDL